ncbi:MAG: WD40 repeat domain-containing protein, partial [Xanthobacteraceae bacterium]|nr:WD40 repeat domain-containing protein [Xanthobacteraceae bacterium]
MMSQFDPGESPSIASITDRVRPLAVGMAVTSIHFLGDTAVFIGAEENAALVNDAGDISPVAIHGGAILCAASDGARVVTGGDDGKLVALDAKGAV